MPLIFRDFQLHPTVVWERAVPCSTEWNRLELLLRAGRTPAARGYVTSLRMRARVAIPHTPFSYYIKISYV